MLRRELQNVFFVISISRWII